MNVSSSTCSLDVKEYRRLETLQSQKILMEKEITQLQTASLKADKKLYLAQIEFASQQEELESKYRKEIIQIGSRMHEQKERFDRLLKDKEIEYKTKLKLEVEEKLLETRSKYNELLIRKDERIVILEGQLKSSEREIEDQLEHHRQGMIEAEMIFDQKRAESLVQIEVQKNELERSFQLMKNDDIKQYIQYNIYIYIYILYI